MSSPHKIFIISGPSGVGKTTIAKAIRRRLPWLATSVTYTTRAERVGKKEDKTMVHVDEETFRDKVNRGEFLEWAVVHGNLYGTDGPTVRERLIANHLLLNIDPQGALQVKRKLPDVTVLVFLNAESPDELVRRISARQQMDPSELARRLRNARAEQKLARQYDYVVLNRRGHLSEAVQRVAAIITQHAQPAIRPRPNSKATPAKHGR